MAVAAVNGRCVPHGLALVPAESEKEPLSLAAADVALSGIPWLLSSHWIHLCLCLSLSPVVQFWSHLASRGRIGIEGLLIPNPSPVFCSGHRVLPLSSAVKLDAVQLLASSSSMPWFVSAMTSILRPFSGTLDPELGLFPPGRFSSGYFPAGNALGSHLTTKSSQEPNPPSLALTPSEPDDPTDCYAVCHMHPRTRDSPCMSRYASSHEATSATADAAAMSALGIMYLDL
ncbi:hypothetical protein CPLU01_05755 [Colletotrichum plurivorum]|uniref:Uncharacterized protein n=1 Tax=Colletotrichum plurivorum TaxID=2175906 RepID=A0A8H6KL48_9PEZI|nr:hypothetical protein CPLU01_05755 [Colletotrichum plurivorum]